MDLTKVIRQLYEEMENLDAAILSLEKLQETGKRHGKTPEWLADVDPPEAAKPKRKPGGKAPRRESPRESGEG